VSTDELKELLSSYVGRRVASKLFALPSPRRTDEARAELERAVALLRLHFLKIDCTCTALMQID
jgi:hypothetical protein